MNNFSFSYKLELLLKEVTKNNFNNKFSELEFLVKEYNTSIKKDEIILLLNSFFLDKENYLNVYQKEILIEIINCIEGFCTPVRFIKLQ